MAEAESVERTPADYPHPDPRWAGKPVGIDVSSHQGKLDPEAFAAAGFSFVIIKSSEGVAWEDPKFRKNWRIFREAKFLCGAYHFCRVSRSKIKDKLAKMDLIESLKQDAREEARDFIQSLREVGYFDVPEMEIPEPAWQDLLDGMPFPMVAAKHGIEPGVLPLTLDIEWDKRASGLKARHFLLWTLEFAKTYIEETGRIPWCYTGPGYWRYKLLCTSELEKMGVPLWEVDYRGSSNKALKPKPMVRKDKIGWATYLVWQWSSKFTRPDNPKKKIDVNRFNGTMIELLEVCRMYRAAEKPVPIPIVEIGDPELVLPDDPGALANFFTFLFEYFRGRSRRAESDKSIAP